MINPAKKTPPIPILFTINLLSMNGPQDCKDLNLIDF